MMEKPIQTLALIFIAGGCFWLADLIDPKSQDDVAQARDLTAVARSVITDKCEGYDGLLEVNNDLVSCLFTSTLEGDEKEGVAKLEQDLSQEGISLAPFSEEQQSGIAHIQRHPNSGWAVITAQ